MTSYLLKRERPVEYTSSYLTSWEAESGECFTSKTDRLGGGDRESEAGRKRVKEREAVAGNEEGGKESRKRKKGGKK